MALASMGHGDELAVVDRNFPVVSLARRLVRLDGVSLNEAATAIFSVFPIDTFVSKPLVRMEVLGEPSQVTVVQQEFLGIAQRAEGRDLEMGRSNALSSIGAPRMRSRSWLPGSNGVMAIS